MRPSGRFLAVLMIGLGLLAWGAWFGLTRTTRLWFEKDIRLRSTLAVASAQRSLLANWSAEGRVALTAVLDDITHDERIMAAAACAEDGTALAATSAFPASFTCASLARAVGPRPSGPPGEDAAPWSMESEQPGGAIHLSAVRLEGPGTGFIVLVHDLRFIERRDATTRNQAIVAFFVLALAAALVTLIAARLAWKGWLGELRNALTGRPRREFRPLVRDLRELAARLSHDREGEVQGGPWTPARLRATLTQHLHGEQVVIVANREPYIHEKQADGTVKVVHPASGLVTALEPVMRACSGVWIAHGSGSADRETSDAKSRVKVPPGEESYVVRRVWLSEQEEAGYYYGFSNEGLWPLCHLAHARPVFRTEDWEQYRLVNQKFADAVFDEVDVEDPIVLVQDYHFALAPKMIRERLPRATILTFWHIPWPNAEHLGICPWRQELLEGLLGSSIVGFHTQQHANNFIDGVDAFLESRIDRENRAIERKSRKTLVRPYPISIEWPVHWLEDLPSVAECKAEVYRELKLPPGALLGVGVDRLDYTKGIEERLQAVDELLARYPEFRGRYVFAQLAAPSRTRIERYRELNERIEVLTQTINARWATGDWNPILLLRAHHEPKTVFRYYRAAQLCYVSSLHDGMNLVAKEFVAARDDEQGVLLLSQFTGAARELTEALIVNPYDLRQASDAMAAALHMPAEEQRERMRSMRSLVAELNVYRWAGRMLIDAAQVRQRERLSGRLSGIRRLAGLEPS